MPSIFLSHNSRDKYFVRKLKEDLKGDDIIVWFDEDEMKVGDSLILKISEGITNMEYLGVVLSANSVDSEWVKKEVAIAMTQEIKGKRVKVLPILLEKCSIPPLLEDKFYADFSESFIKGYSDLLRVIAPEKDALPDISEAEIEKIIEGESNIYMPEELKEVLLRTNPLSFNECEKLSESIKVFRTNKTVILEYMSSMSLKVAESLRNHKYDFNYLCEYYFAQLDELYKGVFGFGHLDGFSDFLKMLLKVIDKYPLRKKIIERIREMGKMHNRWYVQGLFGDIVCTVQSKNDAKIIYDILKDSPDKKINEYLDMAKTEVSTKLLSGILASRVKKKGDSEVFEASDNVCHYCYPGMGLVDTGELCPMCGKRQKYY